MAQLRELRGRIKAVGNIKRITKTMQMIATAKFQASVRRATQTKPYTQKIGDLVGELAASLAGAGEISHPLLSSPEPAVGKQLILIVTSNRGLCGAYNANVLRTAAHTLRDFKAQGVDIEIEVVGKKGMGFCKFNKIPVATAHTQMGDQPSYEEVNAVAESYMKRFEAGEFDAIKIVYMKFITNSRQEPTVQTVLPMEPPKSDDDATGDLPIYEFSPSPEELLAALLPITVKTQVFQVFNDAAVSEQVMRMVAMKSATDNADQMRRGLTRTFNRARQAQITTELTEIVGGAAALE